MRIIFTNQNHEDTEHPLVKTLAKLFNDAGSFNPLFRMMMLSLVPALLCRPTATFSISILIPTP